MPRTSFIGKRLNGMDFIKFVQGDRALTYVIAPEIAPLTGWSVTTADGFIGFNSDSRKEAFRHASNDADHTFRLMSSHR